MNTQVTIREFRVGDEAAFRSLNEAWISRYFVLEPKDVDSLSDPQGTILARGGKIFMAEREGETVGCCALLVSGADELEVAKMAVSESCRRGGIGRQLLMRCISEARALGVRRLYLETNRKLEGAVRLYEAMGFRHVAPERVIPSPYARSNVSMELYLDEMVC